MGKAETTSRAPDLTVTLTVAMLTAVGLVLVYSSSSLMGRGIETPGGAVYFRRSLFFAVIGFFAYWAASRTPPEWLRRLAYPGLLLSVVLLSLVWVPTLGVSSHGAVRWVDLGFVRFQPSELAKLAVVVFLAHSLAKRGERVTSFAFGFLPNVVVPGIPILLVLLEPDLGTAVVMAALVFAVAYAGGVRVKHLAVSSLPALMVVAGMIWFVPFRRDRFLAFLDPWQFEHTAGHQLVQSLLAFGTGGLWGVGLGASRQKLHYLPEAHTDFILSIWAEECGLLGVLFVLAVFAVLIWRGFSIALAQEEPFRRLLATGITTWLALQGTLNALVVMGLLPTKGLPFPFLSYGGTGLVVTLAAAGVLAGLGRKEATCA